MLVGSIKDSKINTCTDLETIYGLRSMGVIIFNDTENTPLNLRHYTEWPISNPF